MAGYSANPLTKKLGIKPGFIVLAFNAPKDYPDFFSDWQQDAHLADQNSVSEADFIHLFCYSFKDLETLAQTAKPLLRKNGLLWVSWPKGSSGIPTDLKRDAIRDHMLAIGLVDTKVAAIDEIWSGLKFVDRLKDR